MDFLRASGQKSGTPKNPGVAKIEVKNPFPLDQIDKIHPVFDMSIPHKTSCIGALFKKYDFEESDRFFWGHFNDLSKRGS